MNVLSMFNCRVMSVVLIFMNIAYAKDAPFKYDLPDSESKGIKYSIIWQESQQSKVELPFVRGWIQADIVLWSEGGEVINVRLKSFIFVKSSGLGQPLDVNIAEQNDLKKAIFKAKLVADSEKTAVRMLPDAELPLSLQTPAQFISVFLNKYYTSFSTENKVDQEPSFVSLDNEGYDSNPEFRHWFVEDEFLLEGDHIMKIASKAYSSSDEGNANAAAVKKFEISINASKKHIEVLDYTRRTSSSNTSNLPYSGMRITEFMRVMKIHDIK